MKAERRLWASQILQSKARKNYHANLQLAVLNLIAQLISHYRLLSS
jgi:hypothetical protein